MKRKDVKSTATRINKHYLWRVRQGGQTKKMNHFFSYVGNDVDVFRDADFVEPDVASDDETILLPKECIPELEETVRFLRGDNISFEEVFTKTSSREGLVYTAYIHTKSEIDTEILRQQIENALQKKLKKGFRYNLKVEQDRPISYSPSRQDYVITIKTC